MDGKDRLKVYGCLVLMIIVVLSIVIFGFYFKLGVSEFRIPVIGLSVFYGLVVLIIIIRFRIEIAGIIVEIPGIVVEIPILVWKSISKFLSSKFQKEEASIPSYGGQQCVRCGRMYEISVAIEDIGNEVRVAACRVCPYAICEHCANLGKVTRLSCPACGVRHLWEIHEMLLLK